MQTSNASYIDRILFNTPNECLKFFSRHLSVLENLQVVYSKICESLKFLFLHPNCLHFFINPNDSLVHILIANNAHGSLDERDDRKFPINRYETKSLQKDLIKQITQLSEVKEAQLSGFPRIKKVQPPEVIDILNMLEIEHENNEGLLIPFNLQDLNLGVFLLWGKSDSKREKCAFDSKEINYWLASLYSFLQSLFVREFEIVDPRNTYLPQFRAAQWKKAAILFADIKNFSLLEERMRQTYAPRDDTGSIRAILNRHCNEMSQIVFAEKGRIERFFGSGLMAIFGEHDESYCEAAVSAVYAALSMIDRFNKLKPIFLKEIIGRDYEIEYNEHLDIGLSVGIDFGTVLFEYLGGDEHQKFTVIGDHVNMAEFLMTEAGSLSNPVCQRAQLLFSPTVDRLTLPWIDPAKKQCESIYDRLKGRSITVFGISKDDFKYELFNRCKTDHSGRSWDNAWESIRYPKPYLD